MKADIEFDVKVDLNKTIKLKKIGKNHKVYVIDDFLSDEECDKFITIAKKRGFFPEYFTFPKLKKIKTVSKKEGIKHIRCETTGHVFDRRNRVIDRLLKYVEKITSCQRNRIMPPRISHYKKGGFVEEHHHFPSNGQIITYLIYLNDVKRGGETYFPSSKIMIPPKKGRALIFYDALNVPLPEEKETKRSGKPEVDPNSLHSALPVLQGEKWIMVGCIKSSPFHMTSLIKTTPKPRG